MNKKGQFYLVAGLIIISIIIGLIAMVNYTKKSQTIIVNALDAELKIETQKVLIYDLGHVGETMREYGVDYSSHLGSEIELYFIIGEDLNIDAYQYINGIETNVSEIDEASLTIDTINNKIILDLSGVDYEFVLVSGKNFYYLISQEIKGEYFVATN